MIAIITQARINSNRLPRKILCEAGGKPFLQYHIERLQQTGLPVLVATTNDGSEAPILDFCRQFGLPCFRGDEQNVLQRFYDCAREHWVQTIIRVTSDCPLIDGNIIAAGIKAYQQLGQDQVYYSNALVRTYPRGMDYEIFSFKLLEEAWRNATEDADREHVTPYIWKNRSGTVELVHDVAEEDNSRFRITLDTPEDKELLTRLIEDHKAHRLNCQAITDILKQHPELVEINKSIEQKKV